MTHPPTQTRNQRFLPDILGVLVVAIVSWNFTFGLEQALDIGLYDESHYLWLGVQLKANGLPDAANAPLYAIWYHLLGLFQPDRVDLYYLNYKLLNLLPPLLLYALLRVRKVDALVALGAACLLVTCGGNLETWPKVSHFALCILLGGLAISSLFSRPAVVFGIVSLTALAASFVRPEYFVGFVLAALTCCIFALRTKHRRDFFVPAAVGAVALVAVALLGFPLGGESGRSFVAFQQHFSHNWVAWTGSDLNPWTDANQIVTHCFGDARSAMQCAAHRPALVFKHILTNTIATPGAAADLLLYPPRQFAWNLEHTRLLGTHFFALIAFAALALGRFSFSRVRSEWSSTPSLTGSVMIILIPPLMASILIYPRAHYLLLLTVPLLALFLILSKACCITLPPKGTLLGSLAMGAFFLFATPAVFKPTDHLPVQSTIAFFEDLEPNTSVQLLEAEGGFHFYLGPNWNRVEEYSKTESFHLFRERKQINAIVLTERLAIDSRFKSDPEWLEFLSDPQKFGFVRVAIPRTGSSLFYKGDLFETQAEMGNRTTR